jgi:16S rRNA (guanine527-N7)-methyltransferase
MIDVLELKQVEIINDRVEAVGQHPDHREAYDWVLARAVAGLPTLVEYLLPLVRVGGIALAQKGESASQEAQEAQHAIRVLGGQIKQLTPVELPGVAETHYLVEISKVASTPSGYPRRVGVPSKKPL